MKNSSFLMHKNFVYKRCCKELFKKLMMKILLVIGKKCLYCGEKQIAYTWYYNSIGYKTNF